MDHLILAADRGGDGATVASLRRMTLRADVHLACVGPDAVLLDVAHDSYHCLADGAEICRALESGEASVSSSGLTELLEAGLLTQESVAVRRRPPALPSRSVIHSPKRPFRLSDLRPAGAALGHVRQARKETGLQPYLQLQGDVVDPDPLATIAAAKRFWTLLPYLPIEGECLVRSAMLAQFLRSLGLSADWVFGVRLCPFSAHCWVQVEDVCLNDDVERLLPYTPILVR